MTSSATLLWSVVWASLLVTGALLFVASRSSIMNPPQCHGDQRRLPDGSRCIVGANIGSGVAALFGIGLAGLAGLILLITPPVALILRAWARRAGKVRGVEALRVPIGPLPQPPAPSGAPDGAGRLASVEPTTPQPSYTSELCVVSTVTGTLAVAFLVLCALFSVPLGVVAVVTGTLGLTQRRALPADRLRMAVAGIGCGLGSNLALAALVLVFG